jgi:Transposase DDE domain
MGKQAKARPCLKRLVLMAVPILQAAERQCPRKGRGAKTKIPDWFIASLIMCSVLKKKKTKSAQYRFLRQQRSEIAGWLGERRFPSRATYFRRYRRAHQLFQAAIRIQGRRAIAEGVTRPHHVAVDKSLLTAHGPPWHKRDREAGKIPAGVDTDATWGYSEHHGWVHGYSYEVVVTSAPRTLVFPLLASVDRASVSEPRSCMNKVPDLPAMTKTVSADSGYDANYLGEAIEYDERDRRTGRRFLCPENPRNPRPQTQPSHADWRRDRSRQRRQQRRRFLRSLRGRRLYARRKKTVEPFNQWLKSLFELQDRVWHRGLDNNRTQLLSAIFVYQLLVRHNFAQGMTNGQIRWILDGL